MPAPIPQQEVIGLFPGFTRTHGGDGSPDTEQGDELRVALPTMLLHPHADCHRILPIMLLPDWSTNWLTAFSLAAPHSTAVAAKVGKDARGGRPGGDATGAQVRQIVIMPYRDD